ncbi:hypothetical protein RDWZM_005397 [Blomia tropicalis]|uniref:C2H2-type domain-containing protein n=1 Tax=Blomia tropicalis TaxID=40697 RepID=A0A9Q0M5I9_BLOTA|nr:hypothetical protein RDWZM_005397 [Blomia tropicalis]
METPNFKSITCNKNVPEIVQRLYKENICFRETLSVMFELKRVLQHIMTNHQPMLDHYRPHYMEFMKRFKLCRDAFNDELSRYPSIHFNAHRMLKCKVPECRFRGHHMPEECAFNESEDEVSNKEMERYETLQQISALFTSGFNDNNNLSAGSDFSNMNGNTTTLKRKHSLDLCESDSSNKRPFTELNKQQQESTVLENDSNQVAQNQSHSPSLIKYQSATVLSNTKILISTKPKPDNYSSKSESILSKTPDSILEPNSLEPTNTLEKPNSVIEAEKVYTGSNSNKTTLDDKKELDADNPYKVVKGKCQVADCECVFNNIYAANFHFRSHGKLFKCGLCAKLFSSRLRVLGHFKEHKKLERSSNETKDADKNDNEMVDQSNLSPSVTVADKSIKLNLTTEVDSNLNLDDKTKDKVETIPIQSEITKSLEQSSSVEITHSQPQPEIEKMMESSSTVTTDLQSQPEIEKKIEASSNPEKTLLQLEPEIQKHVEPSLLEKTPFQPQPEIEKKLERSLIEKTPLQPQPEIEKKLERSLIEKTPLQPQPEIEKKLERSLIEKTLLQPQPEIEKHGETLSSGNDQSNIESPNRRPRRSGPTPSKTITPTAASSRPTRTTRSNTGFAAFRFA